ncbi:hypothetical protein BV20DRAFT_328521 [Pilatotrama ljubarskyi]|nr:hypothetical protein BV20DRAFT_328521 [Pilatotrama ljubarskyi]
MAIFSLNKKASKPAAPRREVKFAPTEAPKLAPRDPRTALALDYRVPSPFPTVRPVCQTGVGGKSGLSSSSPKWRPTARRARPLLVKKGTPGVIESSGEGSSTEAEARSVRRKTARPYYFSRKARYVRRQAFQPGDRVLVNDFEGIRSFWRHGVIASFQAYPPQREMPESPLALYAVTFEVGDEKRTKYFNPRACGILYDTLLSTTASKQ